MECYEAIDLMEDEIAGCLAVETRPGFDEHLEECDKCRNYLDQLRLTVAALEHLPPASETSRRRSDLLEEFRRHFRTDRRES